MFAAASCLIICPIQLLGTGQPRVPTRPTSSHCRVYLFLSLVVGLIHLDPRRYFLLFVLCFCCNFALVGRGVNKASIIYANFFFTLLYRFNFLCLSITKHRAERIEWQVMWVPLPVLQPGLTLAALCAVRGCYTRKVLFGCSVIGFLTLRKRGTYRPVSPNGYWLSCLL